MDVLVPSDLAGVLARASALAGALQWVLARQRDLGPCTVALTGAAALYGGPGGDVLGWGLLSSGLAALAWARASRRGSLRPRLSGGATCLVLVAVWLGATMGPSAHRVATVLCCATGLYGGLLTLEPKRRLVWSRRILVEDGSAAEG